MTPSGIDHDYNFLHSIEHKIERSEKEIIEERGLVDKKELQAARTGIHSRRRRQNKGDENIHRRLIETRTRVDRAPTGMKRNLENETSWSKNRKGINWQIEWISGDQRTLSKALDAWPLGYAYDEMLQDARRKTLTQEEKNAEYKKRKFAEDQEQKVKRIKTKDQSQHNGIARPFLQDPMTSTWSLWPSIPSVNDKELANSTKKKQRYHFYLHRPYTPSSFPKIVIPLDGTQPLQKLLEQRTLLEFPTIYVLENTPEEELPEKFMLEKDFFTITGQGPLPIHQKSPDDDDSSDQSSGSDLDDSEDGVEEGEIV
ncbi:HIT zinc finger [Phlyctema vagabunda]|uniref:HIT zinc finger n=1 Tax=Phlyctema vagabunda TaxID=108571 RepID=A0ABR4PDT9_9HELO